MAQIATRGKKGRPASRVSALVWLSLLALSPEPVKLGWGPIAFAAVPPDVRKVSDLPGAEFFTFQGATPQRLGRSPLAPLRVPVRRSHTAHQAAQPRGRKRPFFRSDATTTPSRLIRYEDSRLSMACTYSIVAYGEDEQKLQQAVTAAFDEVDRIDRLMSHYKPDSPLSQLNREAAQHPVKTDPELFLFLRECVRYSRLSQGAFDITVGPLMQAWGFFRGEGRRPSDEELAQARQAIGSHHLLLDERKKTVAFDRAGVTLDLGGIAKGYAVDRVVALLKARGITRALLSAGGSTIYALGTPPESEAWEVQVQDPLDARKVALTVRLKDQALSVSGSTEKYFELNGQRYSHIMDPRTGRPVMDMLSVAVITPTGTVGDALDNVFYVQGVARSRELLQHFPGTEVFFFLPDNDAPWRLVHLKNQPR